MRNLSKEQKIIFFFKKKFFFSWIYFYNILLLLSGALGKGCSRPPKCFSDLFEKKLSKSLLLIIIFLFILISSLIGWNIYPLSLSHRWLVEIYISLSHRWLVENILIQLFTMVFLSVIIFSFPYYYLLLLSLFIIVIIIVVTYISHEWWYVVCGLNFMNDDGYIYGGRGDRYIYICCFFLW